MFCTKCGTEIKTEHAFCPVCGKSRQSMPDVEQTDAPSGVRSRQFSGRTKIAAGILIFLFCVVAGYFSFPPLLHYFSGPNNAPKAVDKNSQRNDKEALRTLLLNYTKAWSDAVNNNNFALAEKYLLPGSELLSAQRGLHGNLQKDGVRLELIKAEIGDISSPSDQGIATVNVLEEYYVFSPGGKRQVSRCSWTYTANYREGEGWRLSKIAENPSTGSGSAPASVVTQEYNQDWIHVKYPQIEKLASVAVQNKINDILKRSADEFFASMKQIAEQSKSLPNNNRYSAESGYSVKWQSADLISLVYYTRTYTGGAHGSQIETGYTFDLRTGDLITLRNKVGDDKIRAYNDMIQQQIRAKNIPIFKPYTGISDKTTYYLADDKTLVVIFQQYEIAPYSSGILRFELPY